MNSWSVSMDVTHLIGDRVRGLKEYAPEPPAETARRLGLKEEQLIKLNANENPYGPTEHTREVLRDFRGYHLYPDPLCRRLREAISSYIGVEAEHILVGNGSDELIDLILKAFRPAPDGGGIGQVIDLPPTFGMYQFYATINDLQVITIPRDEAFQVNLDAIAALCHRDPRPRIVFVTSPNNPDGQLLSDDALKRMLELPLIVVLDEAYVEFGGASRVSWVPARRNLIVLRTFSKWAGLAGLRVGYGVFPKEVIHALWRLKSPYNVNAVAQVAALATLQDLDQALENVARIREERARLIKLLKGLSFLTVFESQANFVLCRLEGVSVADVRQKLEPRGILIRYFDRPGLDNYIRISVGTVAQTDALIVALRELDREQENAG